MRDVGADFVFGVVGGFHGEAGPATARAGAIAECWEFGGEFVCLDQFAAAVGREAVGHRSDERHGQLQFRTAATRTGKLGPICWFDRRSPVSCAGVVG